MRTFYMCQAEYVLIRSWLRKEGITHRFYRTFDYLYGCSYFLECHISEEDMIKEQLKKEAIRQEKKRQNLPDNWVPDWLVP